MDSQDFTNEFQNYKQSMLIAWSGKRDVSLALLEFSDDFSHGCFFLHWESSLSLFGPNGDSLIREIGGGILGNLEVSSSADVHQQLILDFVVCKVFFDFGN